MSNKAFAASIVIILVVSMGPILLVLFWDEGGNNESSVPIPTLSFTLNTEEPNQEEVTATVVARTTDSQGILSITLPDNSIQYQDVIEYKITENGSYQFEVEAKNGQKDVAQLEVMNIRENSPTNPYLPKGFSYLEGEVANRICHSR